jgi:uncharacterized protein (TIGR03067 family)
MFLRRIIATTFVLGLVLPLTAGADDKELAKLAGEWQAVEATLAGLPVPRAALLEMKLTIRDGRYVVVVKGTADEGSLRVDPKASPKEMDIIGEKGPNMGKMIPAIYELTDKGLRICYALEGSARAKEFAARGDGKGLYYLVRYERVK